MACIPPNPRRVGYIVPIHGPLDMGSIYTNTRERDARNKSKSVNSFSCRHMCDVYVYIVGTCGYLELIYFDQVY